MTESSSSGSPSQQLAHRIADRLTDKGLLTSALAAEIDSRVAEGKMQSSDWKLTFEKALDLHKKS